MKNTIKLTDNELQQVVGGTFTANMFWESDYHRYGITTKYHWWDPDEFWLPDGTKTNEHGANLYIKSVDPDFYYKTQEAWDDIPDRY